MTLWQKSQRQHPFARTSKSISSSRATPTRHFSAKPTVIKSASTFSKKPRANARNRRTLVKVSAIIKKRKFRLKTQYLVRWLGFGPEHDVWKDEDELFGCADLIRIYEHATGNIEWMEPASWQDQ